MYQNYQKYTFGLTRTNSKKVDVETKIESIV